MDQWFRQLIVNSRNSEGGNCGVIPKLDLLHRELVNLSWDEHQEENVKFLKDRNGGISEFVENTNDFAASPKSVVRQAVAKRVVKNAVERVLKNETSGFSEGQVDDEDNGTITKSAKKLVEKVINKVLNCEGTISVRDRLLIRKQGNTVGGENLIQDKQKKPRMPYHYDILDHQSPETIRCSKRVPTLPKFQVCPCRNSNAAQTETTIHQEEIKVNIPKSPVKLVHIDVDELPKRSKKTKALDMPPIKNQVSVGPLFQAQVPECTGVISENDLKWLGTRMWPLKDSAKQSTPIIKSGPVGKGRQHSCKCRSPNSVECFRFHIAEERLKLKLELGSLFYRWRFDQMGEEVSLSWTEAEENKMINDMISWHDKSPNSFWDKAPKLFPFKTREKLVSYYFNVFVVHRRSYQNRVTPEDVDSDDDEKEWGSIGWYFGYKALYVPQ
ncbi:hypothetical protein CASFOL_010853 [Castilleja foliolosa]|uniref:AT-rich interactive domain-containing protein 2 n=1 Tax=Castilleja foliolosa TaxID=1961234 RepID=A0ABD3DTU0_9LAMI